MQNPAPKRCETESELDETIATRSPDLAGPAAAAAAIWGLILEARRRGRGLGAGVQAALALDASGAICEATGAGGLAELRFSDGAWGIAACREAQSLLALYLPLCATSAERPLVVAHLGQSLDGHIATANGDSCYVTGAGNLDHLHRMRALSDAIVVGAGTVAADDPQLTTRRVPGPNPVRVVIDPDRRLPASHGLFSDTSAETIVLHADDCDAAVAAAVGSECIAVPRSATGLDLAAAVARLRARGLHALFVEGGGKTVSAFLEAGLVDRLQIAIAPVVTGAGRPALRLPPRASMADSLRPASRTFSMGGDVLFDCDLRRPAATAAGDPLPQLIG